MKKRICLLFLLLSTVIIVSSCKAEIDTEKGTETESTTETETQRETEKKATYMNITAEQAKYLMDTESNYVILDVRTEAEYNEIHIPGAILIPDYEIAEKAEARLPDKGQTIFVYCRSGRRSKLAAEALVELGYTDIREFGGIIDWPYETE